MKQDYGFTKVNFKKKKAKTKEEHLTKFPEYVRPFISRVVNDKSDARFVEIMQGFQPIELNILEYQEERGSHIAPHFDDFWIWGERILGLNLLQDTVMTFYKKVGETQV